MADIIDASEPCELRDEFVLFDTNIWISIYGNDPRPEQQIYSDFYAKLLATGNTVIVNEQIISEFFNRFCKIEFEALFDGKRGREYKHLRKTSAAFKDRVKVVKEICIDILQDCEYQQSNLKQACLERNLELVSDGELDLTDATLVSECETGNFVLVSHDRDFANSNIRLVTGNPRMLKR